MAGSPTVAEVDAMFKAAVDLLEDSRANGAALLTKIDALQQSVEGVTAPPGLMSFASSIRARLASCASSRLAADALLPVFREYGRLAGSAFAAPGADVGGLFRDVYNYFLDNSKTVTERGVTFGTITANGSNTGDGSLKRLTVDANAYPLEAGHVETKTFECLRDQSLGERRHAETFVMRGETAGVDSLDLAGSGLATAIASRHAGTDPNRGSMLRNSSFQTTTAGGTVATLFPGWTLDDTTSVSQDTTNFFRPLRGETSGHAISLGAARTLTQKLSVRRTALARGIPYFLRVMYNRQVGSGSLTLRIKLGSSSKSVVLSAQTGWNELALDLDENLWFENFNEDELDVEIAVTSYTSGSVLIDDVILCPMRFIDGTWWALLGGATPWLAASSTLPNGDSITVADTGGAASGAKLQYWTGRAFGRILPSAGSGTVTDP